MQPSIWGFGGAVGPVGVTLVSLAVAESFSCTIYIALCFTKDLYVRRLT